MGNSNSRQKITQPIRNAATALTQRIWIQDKFRVLVQKIKGFIGLHSEQLSLLERALPTPSQGNTAPGDPSSHSEVGLGDSVTQDSTTNNAAQLDSAEEQTPGLSVPDHSVDAEDVSNLPVASRALQTAPSEAQTSIDSGDRNVAVENKQDDRNVDEHVSDSGSHNNDEDSVAQGINEAMQEAMPVLKAYEKRIQALDATYNRLLPKMKTSPLPPGVELPFGSMAPKERSKPDQHSMPEHPTASRVKDSDSGDKWVDTEAAEYVFSSLKVALPEPQHFGTDTQISFQPPSYADKYDANGDTSKPGSKESYPPANTTNSKPLERSLDHQERLHLANYHWHKRVYSGMPLWRNSIRLVEIQPGEGEEVISVIIATYRLDEVAMQYEALSYVWGDPDPPKLITVNGEDKIPVNPNLFDALISLRSLDSPRRIWIDALCLNQMSFAEKSKQVQKMDKIYGLAKTVNIFLGRPALSDSRYADALFRFLERQNAANNYAGNDINSFRKICTQIDIPVEDVCKGFFHFCRQPWWGRIWTLQEFYLAKDEPVWYWGKYCASNAHLKRDFRPLISALLDHVTAATTTNKELSQIQSSQQFNPFKLDANRNLALITRRYSVNGYDSPRRLYREMTAHATNPRDFIYGLRAIFDPVFGRVFVPDYQMRTEVLFACLAVFLIQFECWADTLWWYPSRFAPGKGRFPSWLPDFTKHIQPHLFDVQPLENRTLEPKMVVLNHCLHAEGYVLDRVYGHRHLDRTDSHKIFEELWQYDHSLNNNHECHEHYLSLDGVDDEWFKVFLDMYGSFYAKWTHFNSSFRGPVLQSTMAAEHADKLPCQIAECVPHWDLLRWHALRIDLPGLFDVDTHLDPNPGPGCLENVFSSRMDHVFQKAFADFFMGASIFDWSHFSLWLERFPSARQWSWSNENYWSEIGELSQDAIERRTQAITAAYSGFAADIWPEISRVSWCYSFYYTFLAYVILLDCDDHQHLASIIQKLQDACGKLRHIYFSTSQSRIKDLAAAIPYVATRLNHHNAVVDLFRGRYYLWTDGGFRGISCPGVEACCDKKSIVAIIDGLSLPVIVRDYDESTGEGWLAGCTVIRGVGMLGMNADKAELPADYQKGMKVLFKFR